MIMKLPRFDEEKHLATRLKSPAAVEKYEKFSLGEQIKKIRRREGLTQAGLAVKLGTTQSVIARIEAGKQNMSLRTLIALAAVLGKQLHISLR